MSRPRLLPAAALMILAACGLSEEEKADALATSFCARYSACRAEGFSKSWDSVGQCQNKEGERWMKKLSSIDGDTELSCTLDEKSVAACTEALDAVDCGGFSDKSWEADCATVLTCTQGLTADW